MKVYTHGLSPHPIYHNSAVYDTMLAARSAPRVDVGKGDQTTSCAVCLVLRFRQLPAHSDPVLFSPCMVTAEATVWPFVLSSNHQTDRQTDRQSVSYCYQSPSHPSPPGEAVALVVGIFLLLKK